MDFLRPIVYFLVKFGYPKNHKTLWIFVPNFGLRTFHHGTSTVASVVNLVQPPTTISRLSRWASTFVYDTRASRGSVCGSWDLFLSVAACLKCLCAVFFVVEALAACKPTQSSMVVGYFCLRQSINISATVPDGDVTADQYRGSDKWPIDWHISDDLEWTSMPFTSCKLP